MDRVRFSSLWERCCVSAVGADQVFRELEAGYNEPHRRYHTGEHIDYCLAQFDLGCHEIPQSDAVELALWFHDLVYDPKACDNEFQSAQRFRQYAEGPTDAELVERVERLIMATLHNHPPEEIDAQYTVDIDLSSFGRPRDEFVEDSNNVRNEFPHLTDAEFARKHLCFLKSLLERPRVYTTDFYANLYEQAARDNIAMQIDKLSRDIGG